MSTEGSTRAVVAAMIANLGIAIAKFVGFVFTMSSSMLAESIHSVADTGNQVLLLFGGRRSRMAPDRHHQFGYGRERYFWAFVVSIVLFTLGAVFALYEGIEKVLHPHPIDSPQWAIGILAVAIVLEGNSFRIAVSEARPAKGASSWRGFIRHTKSPELPVVILEDLGALVGLVFALVAVVIAMITDNGVWDGIGSILIGSLLGVIAVVLASEMKSLLIGESATTTDEDAIHAAIESHPQVADVIVLRTEHVGPEEILVVAKVEFAPDLTMRRLAEVVDEIEARIRAVVPTATRIFLEPDVVRAGSGPIDDPWSGLDREID
jgi:cation diffusion facilitator family transporter